MIFAYKISTLKPPDCGGFLFFEKIKFKQPPDCPSKKQKNLPATEEEDRLLIYGNECSLKFGILRCSRERNNVADVRHPRHEKNESF